MKINWSPPPSNTSPPLRFGWTMSSGADTSAAPPTSNADAFNKQTPFPSTSKGIATPQSPFTLPSLQNQQNNQAIHPLNLPFYNPNSVHSQTSQFISDVMSATKAENSKGFDTQRGPMVQRSLSMAIPFAPTQWYASTSMLVVQLSPEVSVPAQSAKFSKDQLAKTEQSEKTVQSKPVFAGQSVGIAANTPPASPTSAPSSKSNATNIAYNAPPAAPSPIALSAFERKLLNQPLASMPLAAPATAGDTFVSGGNLNGTSGDRINSVLKSTDYANNPFEVLSRINNTEPMMAGTEAKAENSEPPNYSLQAVHRILRGTHHVPDEVLFTAEMDHRLNDNANSVATYAYLPKNGTVLTEPMMDAAGVKAKDTWYAPAIRFGAQAFRPLVQAAPWMNPAKLNVTDTNLWFGSRWNVPLVNYQTADGQEAQVYQLTKLPDGRIAQVVEARELSSLDLATAPGRGHLQALESAPQPNQKALVDNLKMNAPADKANALTTQKLQAFDTANTNAYASVPVTLSATMMSQEQPKFKGRAMYRQWVHDQVAQMEQQGLVLST